MASKKYLFLTALCSLLAVSQVFGQSTAAEGHDYLDTAYVPQSRMEQQQQFLNNESIFPAKPRSMWELGINGGYYAVIGDIPSQPGYAVGLSLRKALGYTFSLRGDLNYGQAKGVANQPFHFENNLPPAVSGAYDAAYGSGTTFNGKASYYPDYSTTTASFALDLIASLNNIMFHKAANKVDWYVLGGINLFGFKTEVNALNGNTPYDPTQIDPSQSSKDVIDAVKDLHDDSYETMLNDPKDGVPTVGDFALHAAADAGMGVAFKVSPRFNIALEQKFTFPFNDYLDGASHNIVNTPENDIVSYTNLRLNFNLGNSSKRTEPLYWVNPMHYAYSELNAPKHMKLPQPVLPDADGDGVTDQFDKCPNTPAGVPVDVHGCPLDTDGDGVPDYKDKQLITPTYCQPVDEDGVGKCPVAKTSEAAACELGTLPSISFSGRSVSLSSDAKTLLANVANQMRQSPACRIVVVGHAASSKSSEQLAWDRVNSVINYLTEQEGIPSGRFIFKYHGVPGDTHTIDLRSATKADQGPNMVAPPHPNLRRSK